MNYREHLFGWFVLLLCVLLGLAAALYVKGADRSALTNESEHSHYFDHIDEPKRAIFEFHTMVWKPTTASNIMDLAENEGQLTNLVNLLVSSGEFCKVRGHAWKDTTPTISPDVGRIYRHFLGIPDEQRTCTVCGLSQERSMPDWPEERTFALTNVLLAPATVKWIWTNNGLTDIVTTNLLEIHK